MEVILLERINRLGAMGDTVRVKNGYARNFLLPRKKALRATEDNKQLFDARRSEIEAKNNESRKAAEVQAKALEGLNVTLVRQSSEEGKLFGAITVRDIAEALEAQGHPLPKSQIVVMGNIKNTGVYPVKLLLHADVTVTLDVTVAKSEQV